MKKDYLLSLLLILASAPLILAQEPNFSWADNIGGTDTDIVYDIDIMNTGEFVAVGRFNNLAEFDMAGPGTGDMSNGQDDIFVAKYDPSGFLNWHLAIGGTGVDYAVGVKNYGTGVTYVLGRYENTVNFGPGPGAQTLNSVGGSDIFIMKVNVTGQISWVRSVGGPNTDTPSDIAVDNAGNVYVTGHFIQNGDFDPGAGTANLTSAGATDIFMLKLDATGNFQWVKQIGGTSYDYASSIAVDNSGNVYAGGRVESNVDLDPGTGTDNYTSNGLGDIFMVKLDASGNYIWGNAIGGVTTDYINDIQIDGNNEVVSTGYFSNSVDFDPGTATDPQTSAGNNDIFVWKVNASGAHQWVKTFSGVGTGQGREVAINDLNEIYVVGDFTSIVDFYPGPGTVNFSSNGGRDNFLVHLNANGDYLNAEFMGTSVDDFCRAIGLNSLSAVDELTLVGNFSGSGDYDPTAGTNNLSSFGGTDGYFVQFTNCKPGSINPDAASLPDLTDECTVFTPTPPSATNDCGDVYYGQPDVTFPVTTQGTTVITWTFDDLRGNVTTQTQNIVISDVTGPVPDAASLPDLTGECSVSMPTAPTATDNCQGSGLVGTPDVTFPVTTQGTTVVTWTFDDGVNTSTQTQNVIINDVTEPVPDSSSLSDITSICEISSITAPTATDNCMGTITGTTTTNFPITTMGTTVVTWYFDDGNGNVDSLMQNAIITTLDTSVSVNGFTLTANAGSGYSYQWIDCTNGNSAINGATNQSYTPLSNGDYAVIVTYGSCSDTSACYNISGVGIEEHRKLDFTVYPNPSNGNMWINLPENQTSYQVEILDVNGRYVRRLDQIQSGQNELNLSLESGVYFIRVSNQIKKIIIQ